MSRRTAYWRKRITTGDSVSSTASKIIDLANGGVGRSGYRNNRHNHLDHKPKNYNPHWKSHTKPMSEDKAKRIAAVLHKSR